MKWWMLIFIAGMATMALVDDLNLILKQKEKLYSYTDGKDWYMCDNENAHCYTDRFKSQGTMQVYTCWSNAPSVSHEGLAIVQQNFPCYYMP